MFSSVRFSSSGLNFLMLLFVVVAILLSHVSVILKCGFGSPEGGCVCGFNVKNLAEFFILHIPNVNSDEHHLLLEILCNALNCAELCLCCRLFVGKKDEMLVAIVSEDRLPVVRLELNEMGRGVERHKVHQPSHSQLPLENLLIQHCYVNQNLGKTFPAT